MISNPNIMFANHALHWMSTGARIYASNRWLDEQKRPTVRAEILEMYQEMGHILSRRGSSRELTWKTIQIRARLSLKYGVGNCESQACVAFDFLARRSFRPNLEIMSLKPDDMEEDLASLGIPTWSVMTMEERGPDHVFLVIGRLAGDPSCYRTWNPDTVICDPWAKRCYVVGTFWEEMQRIKQVSQGVTDTVLLFRLRSGAPWSPTDWLV